MARATTEGTGDSFGDQSVWFYERDDDLQDMVAGFLATALRSGAAAIAIAAESRFSAIAEGLRRLGVDPERAQSTGQLSMHDVDRVVEQTVVGGTVDAGQFHRVIGGMVDRAGAAHTGRVRAYSEMIDVLRRAGNPSCAARLEELWNELKRTRGLSVLCAARQSSLAAGQRAERLVRITTTIADAVTPEQIHVAVVDQAAATLRASDAGLWMLDGEGALDLVRGVGTPVTLPAREAVDSKLPVWAADRACIPIVAHGQVLGAVGFGWSDVSVLDDERRTFLLLIGRYCGQALERLRLLEAEKVHRARAEAAAGVTGALSRASLAFSQAGHDHADLLRSITDQITPSIADACGVLLVSEHGDVLDITEVRHRDPHAEARVRKLLEMFPLRVGEGVIGRVASSGQVSYLPAVDRHAMMEMTTQPYREWLGSNLPTSSVAVPLSARGKVVGVVTAFRERSSPSFTEIDRDMLVEIASRAAIALEAARLYTDVLQARSRAEILHALAGKVLEAERVEQVYDAALDAVRDGLRVERSAILVYDAAGELRFRAWRGLSSDDRRNVEIQTFTRKRRPSTVQVADDVERDPAMGTFLRMFRKEGLAIPLVAGGQLLGVLAIYHPSPHAMTAHEIDLARAIGVNIGASISRFAMIEELQRTARFNEMFLGILGHDLRNPLGAIMTSAQLAMTRSENERLAKPLARIVTSGERMSRMISQLLDFTRVRLGSGIPLVPGEHDVVPIVRQVMDELDVAHPEWTLRLGYGGDTSGVWDADRLGQVFSNLVANAIRHGVAAHGVTVRIDGDDANVIRIEVHNMGVIDAEQLPRLFEPMSGRDRRRDRSSGLGLGLYISREIVRSHGGRIDVRSDDASGTTMVVWLPRVIPGGSWDEGEGEGEGEGRG
jgi:signal transduction histidine kinase